MIVLGNNQSPESRVLMLWYILKRIVQMIPVFFGAIFLIFAMVSLTPGDPVAALAGDRAMDPAVVQAIREQYNLDKPFLEQYLLFVQGIFQGDLGMTFSGRPVTEVLAQTFPISIQLGFIALVIELVFAIGFGVVSGLHKGGWFDSTMLIVSLIVIAVPIFVIAFVAQYIFGIKLGLVPPTVGGHITFTKLILPAAVLGLTGFASLMRLTRAEIAENASSDHVRTAYAHGLTTSKVRSRHIYRNSMIPVVTFAGLEIAALMGGAIVTEGIFNVPGVGNLLFRAINLGEVSTVVSVVTVLVIAFMVCNLIVDLLYAVLDPRIRYA